MFARPFIGLAALAAVTMLFGASPAAALNDRDATAVNQKSVRATFIAGMADANIRAIKAAQAEAAAHDGVADKAQVCGDIRQAKPYYDEARPLAMEVLALIGPDMFGEYFAKRTNMKTLIAIDDDLTDLLKQCPAA